MGSRHERIEIAVDDALKHEIEADAPLALERRGHRWQAVRLRTGMEHLFVALLSLTGVFVLGWPVEPMLVFLVLSLWAGLAFDVARWLSSPGTVEDHLQTNASTIVSGRAWLRGSRMPRRFSCRPKSGKTVPPCTC